MAMCRAPYRLYADDTKFINADKEVTAMTTRTMIQSEPGTDLVAIGERFGFYAAMSERALTVAELAERSSTNASFVRRWLAGQTKEGYVTRDRDSDRYANWCSLPVAA
jgi:hypothetical protein